MTQHRLFEFVWLPTFERTTKKLLDEEDCRTIEEMLCEENTLRELAARIKKEDC